MVHVCLGGFVCVCMSVCLSVYLWGVSLCVSVGVYLGVSERVCVGGWFSIVN